MNRRRLLEGHRRNHRGVTQGLQFHVPSVSRALELDHDKVCLPVNGEQVDAAAAVFPFAELLGDDVKILVYYLDLGAQQSL